MSRMNLSGYVGHLASPEMGPISLFSNLLELALVGKKFN